MSGRKLVNLMCYWGGIVIEHSDLGLSYDGGQQGFIRVKMGTKYNNLVRKLHEVTGIDSSVTKLVLTCKFPTFIGTTASNSTYMRLTVKDDDAVEAMLSVVVEHPRLNVAYLFIETLPASQEPHRTNSPQIQNNPPLQPNYSQQLEYNERSSSPYNLNQSYNSRQFQCGSSSQYPNPKYVVPTQKSLHQAQPSSIPQSPFADVVGFLQQTYTNELSGVDDNFSDSSDEEEMTHVDSEHEVLAVGVTCDEENDAPIRLYTPMEYYTTPQVDPYGEGYDWETPPDYKKRCIFNPKKDQLKKGVLFRSKEDLQKAVKLYNINVKREYRVKSSNKSTWEVHCMNVDITRCAWRLRASIQKKHKMWEVVRYLGEHTC